MQVHDTCPERGLVIETENKWRDGLPQVAMQRLLLLIISLFMVIIIIVVVVVVVVNIFK